MPRPDPSRCSPGAGAESPRFPARSAPAARCTSLHLRLRLPLRFIITYGYLRHGDSLPASVGTLKRDGSNTKTGSSDSAPSAAASPADCPKLIQAFQALLRLLQSPTRPVRVLTHYAWLMHDENDSLAQKDWNGWPSVQGCRRGGGHSCQGLQHQDKRKADGPCKRLVPEPQCTSTPAHRTGRHWGDQKLSQKNSSN